MKCLNAPEQSEEAAGSQGDIRVEASQLITSLSYSRDCVRLPRTLMPALLGSPEAFREFLQANAHRAFLYAISRFGSSEPVPTKAAFACALRTIAAACAELVGSSQR